MVVPTIYIKPIHPSQSRIKHIHTQTKKKNKQDAKTYSHSRCAFPGSECHHPALGQLKKSFNQSKLGSDSMVTNDGY